MNIKNIINRVDQNYGYYHLLFDKKDVAVNDSLKKHIYYFLVPSYGNLGDEAIVEATLAFLEDNFPDYDIVEIDFDDSISCIKFVQNIIRPEDFIVLQGGGNFGTLYFNVEVARRMIIKSFKDNLIVSMPQSFYYDESSKGKKRLRAGQQIYNSADRIIIMARENFSYEQMRKIYNNVILMPDIVFYLRDRFPTIKKDRVNILLCLRADGESIFNDKYALLEQIKSKYENIIISDTCVTRRITKNYRKIEIASLALQFSEAKVVITDRLHGMLFALLTNTPCIVLPSLDRKIYGTYEWIKDNPNIIFCDNNTTGEIISKMECVIGLTSERYDYQYLFTNYFDLLPQIIKNKIHE